MSLNRHMPMLAPLAAFILSTASAMTASHPATPQDNADDFAPAITFSHTVADLGAVDSAAGGVPFNFRIANTGNAPLVLTYVHASCGCLRLDYPRQPIAPGDSATLSGILNPSLIHETPFKRYIDIRSNASTPKSRLFILGTFK